MDTGDRSRGTPREAAAGRDEVDILLEGAHTDPEFDAIGHPPDSKLADIAARRVDQDDPVFDHIERCSQCVRRLRELRETAAEPAQATAPRAKRWWITAIAAGLLLALLLVGALWWTRDAGRFGPGGPGARLVAQLDLRPYGASRGDNGDTAQPLVLRRGAVDLMMILPTGAEAGRYDIQLLDAELKSRISTTADATIKDYRTELRTDLDLSDVTPGRYQLALRYANERWRLFPVTVQ